jgi:hypothetical protein
MARISIEQLREMFTGMQNEAGWDVRGDLLWGYFFVDPDLERLARLAKRLIGEGYDLVDLHPVDDERFGLHVERVETHTPETLDRRNTELEAVAAEMGVESYDGMDAGPLDEEDEEDDDEG